MTVQLDFGGAWKGPRNLGMATLATGTWADIGSAMRVGGALKATAFLSMQIHAGTDAQFRLAGLYDSAGSAFPLAAQNRGTGIVQINDLIYEAEQDVDQYLALQWDLGGGYPYVKLQGKIVGGSATYISIARLTTSR